MESNKQTPPARLPEVLIIPMNTHLPSPQEKTPPKTPPAGLPVSPSASPKPPASPSQNSVSPSRALPKTQKPLSLASPQLLAELAQSQARRSPQESSPERPVSPAASPTSPTSPPATPVTSPVTLSPTQDRGLSLSSPELLLELKQPRPLRHVKPHSSLTTIFSGRGRAARGPVHGSDSAGQLGPHLPPNTRANERREEAGTGQVANGTQR